MADKTWKAAERAISKWFPGSKRRGADFGDTRGGKSDLVYPGYSIEIKHSARPTIGLMQAAVSQAERNREHASDIPLAVIHPKGHGYGDSLVVMRLSTFSEFFINSEVSDDEDISTHRDT